MLVVALVYFGFVAVSHLRDVRSAATPRRLWLDRESRGNALDVS